MKWFYADDSDQQQEFDEEEFQSLVDNGSIEKDTLVWNETMPDWKEVSEVMPDLFAKEPGTSTDPATPPALSTSQEKRAISPINTPYTPTTPPTDPLAVIALVLGIMGFICFPLLGLGGVICGHIAYNKASRNGTPSPNKGLALGGIITGYVGVLIMIAIIAFYGFAMFMAFQDLDMEGMDIEVEPFIEESFIEESE